MNTINVRYFIHPHIFEKAKNLFKLECGFKTFFISHMGQTHHKESVEKRSVDGSHSNWGQIQVHLFY